MTQQFQQHGFQHSAAPEYSRPPLPAQNTGWAVAAMLFFWPLAFSAFSNSAKVFPLWMMGDYEGAHRASAQAKKLGKISLIIWRSSWFCSSSCTLSFLRWLWPVSRR